VDFDVIVIGGGINGLTTAAYMAKAGMSVAVFEARGQCGAHCDTVELGLPGFLHNTHAVWLVPAMSPVMADLGLDSLGLEVRGTDVLYAKTFLAGTNVVQALDPAVTTRSLESASPRDAAVVATIGAHFAENLETTLEISRAGLYRAPTPALLDKVAAFDATLLKRLGSSLSGDDVLRMSGLELLEVLFESDEVRTTPASLGEFTGQWPLNRRFGPLALSLSGFQPMAVHTARGGSHALTHALVKAVVDNGGQIWGTCPVESILTEDGRACGVRLGAGAVLASEEVRARVVVSNLTLAPTFLQLLGEDVIGAERARLVRQFNYDDPQLLSVMYALSDDPEFASAAHDAAIQRSWVGYFGGETLDEMRTGFSALGAGIIPDDVMGGWFIPTRADPGQAPAGCHTAYVWTSVPPCPRRWRGAALDGWDAWPSLGEALGDAVTARFEQYAPGFGDLILERHVMTPAHQEMNNPSAVRGNMIGGSAIPEQYGENRPLPGLLAAGASRSFVPGLYLSNSIHPYGATHLASGYIAACEVAADLGCRDVPWWRAEPLDWFLSHLADIPLNLGVGEKWIDT